MQRPGRLLVIALVSCAVLLFEVLVTRVLSVVLWYHFVFLSISLAMLGVGAPGVWFAVRPPGERTLARTLLAAAVLTPLSVIAIVRLGPLFRESMVFWTAVVLVPMLAMGSAVCVLLLSADGKEIARMYGADLLGATLGAALTLPLMQGIPTPLVVAALGLLPLIALLVMRDRPTRVPAIAIAVAIVGSIAWGTPYRLRYTKSYVEAIDPLYEKWTPTARLAIFPSTFILRDQGVAGFGWGMGARFVPHKLEQLWLEQDGSAGTPITKLEYPSQPLPHLFFDVTSAAYQIRTPQRVCIVGAGGGRDILTAYKSGASRIDAVELNPYTIEAVSEDFGKFSGDPYHLPGVNAIASEGRSFLTRIPITYDVLQISLIDTWAATAAGAFTLSENSLYTLEAFRLYLQRLTPNGVLTVSRWMGGARQLEASRLALLAIAALQANGEADPRAHLVLLQARDVGNLMVFKQPVDNETLRAIDSVSARAGFIRRWPVAGDAPPKNSMASMAIFAGAKPFTDAGFDLSPPTDDRPFFFQTLNVLRPPAPRLLAAVSPNEHAVLQLRRLLLIVAVTTLALFFVPFAFGKRFVRAEGFGKGSLYFALIGLAFMFVELPLIQRFTHFLGHPSYATVVVLGTMLLGAGIGSMTAGRVDLERVRARALVLPLAIALLAFLLKPTFAAALGLPFLLRALVSIVLVAPVGFAMGFAFPVGMLQFGDRNRAWFWAVNGATSVLASVFTLAVSMAFGFSRVLLVGVVAYAFAALLVRNQPVAREG